ncbi:MAG TPA: c-type cytochrome [Blastocatellia bacterium]|nr:c-type cytochrome [Blastocatellia bacterium]
MAEITQSEQLEKRAADVPEPDPIADRSLSVPLLVFSLLLVASLVWALYDEVFGQRPWKDYQRDFIGTYSAILDNRLSKVRKSEREIKESPEYLEREQKVEELNAQYGPRIEQINREVALIDKQISDITDPFQNARAWIAAKNYQLETSTSESRKNSLRKAIEDKKNEKIEISIHVDANNVQEQQLTFDELEKKYNDLRDEKAKRATELVALTKPINDAKKERDDFLQEQLAGLTQTQLKGLKDKVDSFKFEIKQINVANGAVIDRCESCHLGAREPVNFTTKELKQLSPDYWPAFTTHPNKELLKTHDPERFGCSTCHGGNGRGTTSVDKGHGRYTHWLWPLYYKENVQAGCNQCHNRDRVLANADVLNRGKQLFMIRGCVGCHRYEGFDREMDGLSNANQNIKQLEMEKREYELAREEMLSEDANAKKRGEDRARRLVPNSKVMALDQIQGYVNQTISQYDTRIAEADLMTKQLLKDQKKVGPNLKEIKWKLKRDWIPVWLANPQAFRPGTKMPTFRLSDDEVQAISAFLWQSAIDYVKPEPQPLGNDRDYEEGKQLFKTRGCLACHSINGEAIGLNPGRVGGDFAADLSRLGEKANYDYIVRWVHNPRQRLAPYSPSLGRDLTPADYKAKGLPFVFDDQHSKSPVDGRELQVQNMTVMPNFRLSVEDARKIATFLVRQTKPGFTPEYEPAGYMEDTSLFEKGRTLVQRYGCAGCHEIKGFENEQRIGTELTVEGSKPIERLDFALLQEDAMHGIDPYTGKELERGSWYDHKGFFENKLRNPGIYDRGKEKPPEERLRMPNIYLTDEDVTALTTFLLGSVETNLPESLRYTATGGKKAVQDGWWVVQKYNCMGCHNLMVGQDTVLMGLPIYQDIGQEATGAKPTGTGQLPPRLTTEGARVQPEWLKKFLMNPSLPDVNERGSPKQQTAVTPTLQTIAAHAQSPPAAGEQSAQQSSSQGGAQTAQNAAQECGTKESPCISALSPPIGGNYNGVRRYLDTRMPTFNFSPDEVQALVNFFMGASVQQQPYVAEYMEPLKEDEKALARSLFVASNAPAQEGKPQVSCMNCHMTGDPVRDEQKKAPNFLLAPERLKPEWTKRWVLEPQLISPGTQMPSGLFTKEGDRWVLSGGALADYKKDHLDLIVRYMFQMDSTEQARISGGAAAAPATKPPASATTKSARREVKSRAAAASVRAP